MMAIKMHESEYEDKIREAFQVFDYVCINKVIGTWEKTN